MVKAVPPKGSYEKVFTEQITEQHLAQDTGNNEYYMEKKTSTSYPIS